jgi:serine/threonine protein kinase
MNGLQSQGVDEVILDRRYRLGRVIARGGMAVVREATHVYLKNQVAVKLMLDDRVGDSRSHERLLREADYLVRARHPNVVSVLDAGECSKHGAYLVMELLQGRPLDGYMTSRTRLGVEDLLPIIEGLADALGNAHGRGILHRDVKPANVMLTPTQTGAPRAVLVDFGVASQRGEDTAPAQPKLTRPGELPGTIEYMAPEFLAGREADLRVDLYGLGVLAFECLTGLVPYPGGFVVYERASVEAQPRATLERAGISSDVSDVIARAISLDPDARFQSAMAFYGALLQAASKLNAPAKTTTDLAAAAAIDVASRRAHTRAPYVAPLRVSTPNGIDVDGRTEDVAEGGILLISQQPFVQGDVVKVRMPLPMTGRLEIIPAIVRWAKPGRLRHATGLAFDEMSERAREEIRQYVTICSRDDRAASPEPPERPGAARDS